MLFFRLFVILVWIFTLAQAGHPAIANAKKAVESPDKTQSFQVERLSDYSDPFNGKMLLRLTETKNPANMHQRIVEGTRVRTMTPPAWLDNEWVAFAYNVGKNTSGFTFYNAKSHETLLLEVDIVAQLMGATGTLESEMQSLVLTQYTDKRAATQQLENLTWGAGIKSLFPLYLPSSTKLEKVEVPDRKFVDELKQAMEIYRTFCAEHKAKAITPELGTESFDLKARRCAFLCAMDTTPTLMILPLEASDAKEAFASARIIPLPQTVKLSSVTQDTADEETSTPENQHDTLNAVRFTTKSIAGGKFLVAQENYDDAQNETQLVPFCEVAPDGTMTFSPKPQEKDTKTTQTR